MNKRIEFLLELIAIDTRELWEMYDNSDKYETFEIAYQQKIVENKTGEILTELGFEGVRVIRKFLLERLGKETYA